MMTGEVVEVSVTVVRMGDAKRKGLFWKLDRNVRARRVYISVFSAFNGMVVVGE
jgi:hypothetical protein